MGVRVRPMPGRRSVGEARPAAYMKGCALLRVEGKARNAEPRTEDGGRLGVVAHREGKAYVGR